MKKFLWKGPKKHRPPLPSYGALLDSLHKAWKIESVAEKDSIWRMGQAAQKHLPQALRLLVWNICKGAGDVHFEHDFRHLLQRSDLALIQEALLSQKGLKTYLEPGFEAVHAASYTRRDGLRDGVMTLSRAESMAPHRRIICKYPEPVFKTPKTAHFCQFAVLDSSTLLSVVNVHATLFRSVKGSIDELHHLLSSLPQEDGPMILAGDFNTISHKYRDALTREMAHHGLMLAGMEIDSRSPRAALDHVFVRGLRVRSATVEHRIRSSDHFPLLLDLQLDGDESGAV